MTFSMLPQDVLVLYGLLALFFFDPLSPPRDVIQAQYQSYKRRIPGAVQQAAVFGIVWGALYACMAVSAFLLYLERADIRLWIAYANLGLIGVMLITTKAWTALFFASPRLIRPGTAHALALIDWFLLCVSVVCYIVFAALGDPSYVPGCVVPAILMAPVLLWLLYAGYLNAAILAMDWQIL